jgi:hypothetical protein
LALFVTLATSALVDLNENAGAIFVPAMLLPLLAAGARRLRAGGQSAWWPLCPPAKNRARPACRARSVVKVTSGGGA